MTTSAYPKFVLQIGYDRFLMSAAEAAKVMDALAAAPRINTDWIDGEGFYIVASSAPSISLEPVSRTVLSAKEYEAREAAAKVAAEEASEA